MIAFIVFIGVGSGAALLLAGYIFGARQGFRARSRLRQQARRLLNDVMRAREDLAYQQATAEALTSNRDRTFEVLLEQNNSVHEIIKEAIHPLVRRDKEVEDLRVIVQDILTPLMKRERLSLELSDVQTGHGRRSDLTHLLDQISEKGQFEAVLLSDDNGLPLSASSNARDLDRLAALSSLVLLFADRAARGGEATPLSLLIHDDENKETLCRIFEVGDQRLLLTAVSRGLQLTPVTLDAALTKVDNVLWPEIEA